MTRPEIGREDHSLRSLGSVKWNRAKRPQNKTGNEGWKVQTAMCPSVSAPFTLDIRYIDSIRSGEIGGRETRRRSEE